MSQLSGVERLPPAVEPDEAIDAEAAIGQRVRDLVREQQALALQRLAGRDQQALGAGRVERAELHALGFFQSLPCVQASSIKQFESTTDFIPIRDREASPAHHPGTAQT